MAGKRPDPQLVDARRELETIAGTLDLPRIILLQKMAEAMSVPLKKRMARDTDLATPTFEAALSNQLVIHHATSDEPVNKKSFEYLLKNAFEAEGKTASLNPKTGTWDVQVEGVPLSCKTQAGRGISATRIEIQKLMEARWIRECMTPESHVAKAVPLMKAHLGHYQRILMLRAFRESDTLYRYRLIEVPVLS